MTIINKCFLVAIAVLFFISVFLLVLMLGYKNKYDVADRDLNNRIIEIDSLHKQLIEYDNVLITIQKMYNSEIESIRNRDQVLNDVKDMCIESEEVNDWYHTSLPEDLQSYFRDSM